MPLLEEKIQKITDYLTSGFLPERIRREEKIPKRLWDIWEKEGLFSLPVGKEKPKAETPKPTQEEPKRYKTKQEWMYHQPWYKPLARYKKEFPFFSQLTWEELEAMEREFLDSYKKEELDDET